MTFHSWGNLKASPSTCIVVHSVGLNVDYKNVSVAVFTPAVEAVRWCQPTPQRYIILGWQNPGCVLFTIWIVDNCLGKNSSLCGRHPTQCSSKINLDIFQPSEHIEKVFLVKKTPKKCEVIHLVQKGLFHNLFWILLCVICMHTLLLSCFSDFCPKTVFCFEFFPLKLLGDTATPSPLSRGCRWIIRRTTALTIVLSNSVHTLAPSFWSPSWDDLWWFSAFQSFEPT